MRKKLRILIELILQKLPERLQEKISLRFSKIKHILSHRYKGGAALKSWLRLCDFIIVRTNGNRFIEFELTNICNAQCVFCPYPDMLRTDKKFMNMNEEILEKSISMINRLQAPLISFTPTTGDTLLHPEWDLYITRILEQNGIRKATMFTNAIKLDEENTGKFTRLLKQDVKGKMSQVYFSVGGLNAATYKALYKVDRFDLVTQNINRFLSTLKSNKMTTGVHIHVKLLKGEVFDETLAGKILNSHNYPFVYFSHSDAYFSNNAYKRNAIISYYPDEQGERPGACAYLDKTRFAADGGIWADGCVISEMPGDNSLRLGHLDDPIHVLEDRRQQIINDWESHQIIPKPCQGCTVYRCRK
jgi:hypothetical protein